MSRIWDVIIDLLVALFRIESRIKALEEQQRWFRQSIVALTGEVTQLTSDVKALRDELHPADLRAVRWHVGPPIDEEV